MKGEHWLGLKKISCLTSVGVTKLRVDLIDFVGHSKFHVGTPSNNYRLTIGGYRNWEIGAAGANMTSHNLNGMPFTTHNGDNDKWSGNCAVRHQGAWWHNSSTHSNLNGGVHTIS